MTYQPNPIDISHVKLSEDIQELIEQLAFHAHEVWSQRRIAEGWTFGETRNDQAKQHPCLVPFEALEDSEKQYDRNAATETLKAILALGYRIIPSPARRRAVSSSEANFLAAADEMLNQLQAAQQSSSELELSVLLLVWNARREEDRAWLCQPELYRQLGRRFLKLGEAPLAREVAQTALELTDDDEHGDPQTLWAHDVELRQIYGLALARSGSPELAQQVLAELRGEGNADEETLGILARTYKDQAFAPGIDSSRRRELLAESTNRYQEAFSLTGGFWTGINVATLARLTDQPERSVAVAKHVQAQCQSDLKRCKAEGATPEQTYWHLATLGEAALNLGDIDEAGRKYSAARNVAPRNYGDLNVTRRHAGLLLDHWITTGVLAESERDRLDQWMPISPVVVFAGHMIDRVDRSTPRFPEALSPKVETAIERWLDEHQAFIGFSSAACGADLLFQKVIQRRGGESRIVLPYDQEPFRAESVEFAGKAWSDLFDRVIENATQIVIASPKRAQGDGISYDYANLILHGLATVRATELQGGTSEPVGLAVWDGKPDGGRGGTSHVVKQWRDIGMEVHQIDLSSDERNPDRLAVVKNPTPPEIPGLSAEDEETDTRIMAMLFGDAVNFSQLDEQQVGRFIEHFMHPIGNIIRSFGQANVVRNTWGDGIYLVFNHVREAGLCALDICEFTRQQIADNAWKKHRLPEKLNVRIALHAGPVFGCVDPITGIKNYTGTHVSRAARLEPKTPPGEVYASEAFAALCKQYRVEEFSCQYVKQLAWAKHYGSFPTFVVRSGRNKSD